jgi:hypothetical protein
MDKVMNEDFVLKEYMKRKAIQDVRDLFAKHLSLLSFKGN